MLPPLKVKDCKVKSLVVRQLILIEKSEKRGKDSCVNGGVLLLLPGFRVVLPGRLGVYSLPVICLRFSQKELFSHSSYFYRITKSLTFRRIRIAYYATDL